MYFKDRWFLCLSPIQCWLMFWISQAPLCIHLKVCDWDIDEVYKPYGVQPLTDCYPKPQERYINSLHLQASSILEGPLSTRPWVICDCYDVSVSSLNAAICHRIAIFFKQTVPLIFIVVHSLCSWHAQTITSLWHSRWIIKKCRQSLEVLVPLYTCSNSLVRSRPSHSM